MFIRDFEKNSTLAELRDGRSFRDMKKCSEASNQIFYFNLYTYIKICQAKFSLVYGLPFVMFTGDIAVNNQNEQHPQQICQH